MLNTVLHVSLLHLNSLYAIGGEKYATWFMKVTSLPHLGQCNIKTYKTSVLINVLV